MYRLTFFILLVCIAATACKLPPKITYEFPSEMLAHVKADYIKQWEKGRELYNLNCAKCHTTKKFGREVIPTFTDAQLEVYKVRVANTKHETEMSEERVSAEELAQIMVFLTYRKKTAAPANTSPPPVEDHH